MIEPGAALNNELLRALQLYKLHGRASCCLGNSIGISVVILLRRYL